MEPPPDLLEERRKRRKRDGSKRPATPRRSASSRASQARAREDVPAQEPTRGVLTDGLDYGDASADDVLQALTTDAGSQPAPTAQSVQPAPPAVEDLIREQLRHHHEQQRSAPTVPRGSAQLGAAVPTRRPKRPRLKPRTQPSRRTISDRHESRSRNALTRWAVAGVLAGGLIVVVLIVIGGVTGSSSPSRIAAQATPSGPVVGLSVSNYQHRIDPARVAFTATVTKRRNKPARQHKPAGHRAAVRTNHHTVGHHTQASARTDQSATSLSTEVGASKVSAEPTETTAAPVYNTPAPTYTTPATAPTYTAPPPAPAPTYTAPASTPAQSSTGSSSNNSSSSSSGPAGPTGIGSQGSNCDPTCK